MTTESLRDIVAHLATSASALAALGAALDARATGVALPPTIRPHVDDVVDALGARHAIEGASPAELHPLLGELRAFALTNAKLLFAASRGAGWTHTERDLLQAAGDVSAAFPRALAVTVAPLLDGLVARLASPGAAFLDVGVGVAAMSIEMARIWPSLRVVGVDPWAPALALARDNVRGAGLEDRIELREQAGEDVPDTDAFDLAWIPSLFVPERALPSLLRRVHGALRAGGWLLFPTLRAPSDPLAAGLTRLRTAMFGGLVAAPEQVEALLRDHGFVEVRTLPGATGAVTAMVAARRALTAP